MKNDKFVFNEEIEEIVLGGGVTRKIMAYGEDMMAVEVHFEKDAVGSSHTHPHAQMTYILDGVFEFTVDGESRTVKKGDMIYMLPNVTHACCCKEAGVVLDCFNPYREDFIK